MKRLLAMVLICLLCGTGALAAEWAEGLGPEQPLPGVPKIDLSKDAVRMYTNIICSAIMSETSPEWWKQVNPFSSLEVL